MAIALLVLNADAGRSGDRFGRWQGSLQDCRIQIDGRHGGTCQRLDVIQTSDEVLSLHFWRDRDDMIGHRRLQLIGTMKAGEGLSCSEQGCSLTPRLDLLVTGLTNLSFDRRGTVRSAPDGTAAQGRCQWQQRQLHCRFRPGKGPPWTIDARL